MSGVFYDSDSDAPISKGAIQLAKANAAAALQTKVLEKVKEMAKRYADEPDKKATTRPKRMKCEDGAWNIPLDYDVQS
jgi:hypothetical protein